MNPRIYNSVLLLIVGLAVPVAFEPIGIWPAILGIGFGVTLLGFRIANRKEILLWGVLCEFAAVIGCSFWMVVAIHHRTEVTWSISTFLFLGILCPLGALEFPLYLWLLVQLRKRGYLDRSPLQTELFFSLVLPLLFSGLRNCAPHLFPFSLAHSLNSAPWLNQITKATGIGFLGFLFFSIGVQCARFFLPKPYRCRTYSFALPILLIVISVIYSQRSLREVKPLSKGLNVALIQPNVGSYLKMQSEGGNWDKMRAVMDVYYRLTEKALSESPKPQLVIWPETAVPFRFHQTEAGAVPILKELKSKLASWDVEVLTGGYGISKNFVNLNGIFLLDQRKTEIQAYYKNILMPLAERNPFPKMFSFYMPLLRLSNLEEGGTPNLITLRDGTRLGVTICYEALFPEYFKTLKGMGAEVIVNVANDSFFGETNQPYQHAAIAQMSAIEGNLPFVRLTNTGLSFATDSNGRKLIQLPTHEVATGNVYVPKLK